MPEIPELEPTAPLVRRLTVGEYFRQTPLELIAASPIPGIPVPSLPFTLLEFQDIVTERAGKCHHPEIDEAIAMILDIAALSDDPDKVIQSLLYDTDPADGKITLALMLPHPDVNYR